MGFFKKIGSFFKNVGSKILKPFKAIGKVVSTIIPPLRPVYNAVSGGINAIGSLIGGGKKAATEVAETARRHGGKIVNLAREAVRNPREIGRIAGEAVETGRRLIGEGGRGIRRVIERGREAVSSGRETIGEIRRGIRETGSNVANILREVPGKAREAIRTVLEPPRSSGATDKIIANPNVIKRWQTKI